MTGPSSPVVWLKCDGCDSWTTSGAHSLGEMHPGCTFAGAFRLVPPAQPLDLLEVVKRSPEYIDAQDALLVFDVVREAKRGHYLTTDGSSPHPKLDELLKVMSAGRAEVALTPSRMQAAIQVGAESFASRIKAIVTGKVVPTHGFTEHEQLEQRVASLVEQNKLNDSQCDHSRSRCEDIGCLGSKPRWWLLDEMDRRDANYRRGVAVLVTALEEVRDLMASGVVMNFQKRDQVMGVCQKALAYHADDILG